MLYQSGYLTIKSFDPEDSSYELDFPNKEVRKGFITMLAASYFKPKHSVGAWADELADALEGGDTEDS